MRLLFLHNRYLQKGGEDTVVEAEVTLLRQRGHDVVLDIVSNDGMERATGRIGAALSAVSNPAMARRVSSLVADVRPEVVHIHNFFPRLSPEVHRAVARSGVAVVQTLHNFRLLCAAATFFRDGNVCEACLGHVGWPAMKHGCYRGSRIGSGAVVAMQMRARAAGIWHRDVDRFIALSQFAKSKFVEGGLPAERIVVKPNFVDAPIQGDQGRGGQGREGALYVGRLSREKGVSIMVDAWRQMPHIPLSIVGTGPLEAELRAAAPANVRFLGALAPPDVAAAMRRARLLVVPSLWYEGFPMVLVEAGSAGLAVLASRIGSLPEIVEEDVSGRLFTPGSVDELVEQARSLFAVPTVLDTLSDGARRRFDSTYSASANGAMIEAIYRDAIDHARRTRAGPTWR